MNTPGTVAAVLPSAPRKALPAGATDCHSHVFGPLDRFPTGPSTYAIPLADPVVYRQMLIRAGFERGVLIQPAPYGSDTSALEAALAAFGGSVRGIAVADATIADARLDALHAAGVRGLRFIEMRDPKSGNRYAGSMGVDELARLAPRLRERGWHAEIWAPNALISEIFASLENLKLPLVFDHMGQIDVAAGTASPSFQSFVDVLRHDKVYTKLTVCRVTKDRVDCSDVRPFHEELYRAVPDSLVWGSDWPFVRMGADSPDVGRLIDLFQDWTGDDRLARDILVTTPGQLYDFEQTELESSK